MIENVTLFLENDERPICAPRNEFYENRRTTYNNHFLYIVDMLLFNSYGEILLQKRSRRKKEMPGQFHTTVGGHINFGENPAFTLVHETFEEIGTSCFLVPDDQDFGKVLEKLHIYSQNIAIVKKVKDYFRKITSYKDPIGNEISVQDKVFLCFGIFDGSFKSVDRSSDGCERFSIEDLETERKKHPELFTTFLHSYLDEFQSGISDFSQSIKEIRGTKK